MAPRKKKEEEGAVSTESESVATKNDTGGNAEIMDILVGISNGMSHISEQVNAIDKRVSDIETGGKDKFKEDAKEEDIAAASAGRSKIDPKINALIDELLGEDFRAEVVPLGDRPGFRFTLIVPPRLSDSVVSQRPVMDENGKYKLDADGNTVMEDYMPEDRRSRVISSVDSYDAVRQHCEKVRAYIVSYFQKVSKPLPEFKVK